MTRRLISALLILLALSLTPPRTQAANGGEPGQDTDHETIVHRNGAACGVERWKVKTGMDPDARAVDLRHVVATTSFHLRALPVPATLPTNRRIRPVETTVYALDGFLIRYKQETDSDDHLVLSDSGGRTMIAEIPAPNCLDTSSPFYRAIAAVRQAFTARFHPSDAHWQRLTLPMHVIGVAFFDVKHGQSGVAPNAIELHPILAITWPGGGTGRTIPTMVATPVPATPVVGTSVPPTPAHASTLRVAVSVDPNPSSDGTATTITARTTPGVVCHALVHYASGSTARSTSLTTLQSADQSGRVTWTWMPATRTPGPATATVQCVLGGQTGTGTASFTIQ